MKKFKKILALALSLAMVLGMSVTTFAENGDTPANRAKIWGIEDESYVDDQGTKVDPITVKAYQIIEYDSAGFYKEVLENTITKDGEGNLAPTAADALALSKKTNALTATVDFVKVDDTSVDGFTFAYMSPVKANENDTTKVLEAGTWLVLIEGSSKYFYNPVLISVEQGSDGLVYGTLNLNTDTWLDSDGSELYAKKSEPTITKSAEKANDADTEIVGTQYGDILKFTVTADIPGYITGSNQITYSIKDTLTGLALVNDGEYAPTATVGGEADADLTAKVNAAITDGAPSFEVTDFEDSFLTANAGKQIVIIYYAKVTSDAKINVDKLNNTATLTYGTNDSSEPHEKEAETKHYTFGIGTTVNGTYGSETFDKTGEFVKIDENGKISYEESKDLVNTETGTELLAGAEFELHIGLKDGPLFKDAEGNTTFTTGENGRLEINGLDSDVDYYLVETKAPTGYSLNAAAIKVRITAHFDPNETDKLTGYDVTFGEGENAGVTHYKYDTVEGKTELLNSEDSPSNPFGFKNTKLSSLPSTGGIGTTIFTIGGCAIMILAAALYFASRRKTAK